MTDTKTDADQLTATIASELKLPRRQVATTVQLLEEGNTIPFIARYRKEATGSLDEIQLRAVEDALERQRTLSSRKSTVLKTIGEQGQLTAELKKRIESCTDIQTLEAIYLPYKPKRRTRATAARESGLQPLADILRQQRPLNESKDSLLDRYVDPAQGVADRSAALQGSLDILAEEWSEQAETRQWLAEKAREFGKVTSKAKRGKKNAEGAEKFEHYFDSSESVRRIPGHRLLAMLRGEANGILRVGIELDSPRELRELQRRNVHNPNFEFHRELLQAIEDCFERLLLPAIESIVLGELRERAEDEAIEVFGKNLHDLLMAPPAGQQVTMGIDPGFRTGCKVAVVDATGQFLANATIFPTPPKNDFQQAARVLLELVQTHGVQLIAIGNGTASRETDTFVGSLLKEHQLDLTKVVVSESGASIYSASEVAAEEFPDLDVTVRGAISIARRLQDPLAELVKCDAKSIGVGQYQHDVNQKKLRRCLDRVVESCVNSVGVDLNMASPSLLSYVSGIGPKIAKNIVEHRNSNGPFRNRQQLSTVPKLGKKAFEQAAGFLRIREGDQPLDNSAVHPESYSVVSRMASALGSDIGTVVGNESLSQRLDPEQYVDDKFGLPTIRDIIAELSKPGRDPRSKFRVARFDDAVQAIEDLKPGMVLEGTVTNVTHFGAFVDLGVHQDGLVHISQLADQFVSDPSEIVTVGDIVRVKVLEIDVDRKRISLTRKF